MKHFYTILAALLVLCALCPHCWAQRQIEGKIKEGAGHVAFHPKGNIFATSAQNGKTKLWSLRGKLLATFETKRGGGHVAFNPEGTILASADEDSVQLWNVENPEMPKEIPFPEGEVKADDEFAVAVSYSPDGAILAWRTNKEVTLWHIKKKEKIGKLKAERTHDFSGIGFSQDGNTLAWANPKEIVLWNIKELEKAKKTAIPTESYGTPAFSPKEDVLVWREFKKVVLWNTKTQKVIDHFDIEAYGGGATANCGPVFSRDGKRLAIVGRIDESDKVYPETFVLDFDSGLTVARFRVDIPKSIAFSPNGEMLVTGAPFGIRQHYIGPPR